MTVSENPIALVQFRRTPWQFQQTFQTPLAAFAAFRGSGPLGTRAGPRWWRHHLTGLSSNPST